MVCVGVGVLGGGGGNNNFEKFPIFIQIFANTLRRISAGPHPMQNIFGLIYTLKFVGFTMSNSSAIKIKIK